MKKPKLAWKFRQTGRHLGRVLGDLEAEVMETVWRLGSASIRDVWEQISRKRKRSFNTVMTVMNRLTDKGLLRREDRRGSYRYTPQVDRDTFLARISHDVAEALVHEFGDIAVAQFLDVLEDVDPQKLAAFEERVRRRSRR
ncbi:MAG: BlaI/MecI/CopY family transcriptional regulator [bacterium]